MITDTVCGVVEPVEIVLPTKTGDFLGRAGTIFLSGAKLWFNPTDGGSAEVVTSG